MKRISHYFLAAFMATIGLTAATAQAGDDDGMYAVTITNLTRGESFTPIMVATHKAGTHVFQLGTPASPELAAVAEGGDFGPLSSKLMDSGAALDIATNGGLLAPGESTTIMVKMSKHFKYVTVTSMLIPTNDAFIAVNGVKGPKKHHSKTIMSPTYDAGSEPNDELCANMPGPFCKGEGGSPFAGGEGNIHIHAGIHGIGDLMSADFDWRNPSARIVIKRMK